MHIVLVFLQLQQGPASEENAVRNFGVSSTVVINYMMYRAFAAVTVLKGIPNVLSLYINPIIHIVSVFFSIIPI